MIPITNLLLLGCILFSIGLFGVLIRKNAVVMFVCIEIMLNAVNLIVVAFGLYYTHLDGVVLAFFVICTATVEAVIGLALILNMQWKKKTLDIDGISSLKG